MTRIEEKCEMSPLTLFKADSQNGYRREGVLEMIQLRQTEI